MVSISTTFIFSTFIVSITMNCRTLHCIVSNANWIISLSSHLAISARYFIKYVMCLGWRTCRGIFGSPVGILLRLSYANLRIRISTVRSARGNFSLCSSKTVCQSILSMSCTLISVSIKLSISSDVEPLPRAVVLGVHDGVIVGQGCKFAVTPDVRHQWAWFGMEKV